MALNWSAYLADDALNQSSSDQWPDVSTPQPGRPLTATTTTDTASQPAQRLTPKSDTLSPYDSQPSADAYFTDAFYPAGDYFLSDFEGLEPFGDALAGNSTSESSPEPLSATDLLNQTIFTSPRQATSSSTANALGLSSQNTVIPGLVSSRPRAYSGLKNDPMFSAKPGFVEDLTFPNGPSGIARTTTNPLDRDTNPISVSKEPETTSKRTRHGKADALAACWTSPLCPNHTVDGPPPDPTTCGGACAPFLFAPADDENPATIVDQAILANEISISKDVDQSESIIELVKHLKRSESESSNIPSGRVFAKPAKGGKMVTLKQETPSTNPDDDSTSPDAPSDLTESRPTAKPRRRLPHNQVERKYRESLNTQLETLRRVVPSLQPSQQQQNGQNGVDIEDLPTPNKPSKAVVLASATAYIKQMEKDKKQLADENQMLRSRIKALQALVKCEDCSLMQYVMNMKLQTPA